MKILITGVTGFVGQHLYAELAKHADCIIGTTRQQSDKHYHTGDIDENTDWCTILQDVDVVVHLANLAHILKTTQQTELLFHRTNVIALEKLLTDCVTIGVKQFIYLSSIKVNGEITSDAAFNESDTANPQGAYACSKLAAERSIKKTPLNWTIIRPPLIYGAGVGGHFAKLIKLIHSNIPLPFKTINNKRSFIGINNLIDVIHHCVNNPKAYQRLFLVSDDCDLSTPELIQKIAHTQKINSKLFACPPLLLNLSAKLIGRGSQMKRLTTSLQANIGAVKSTLNWQPPYTVEQQLKQLLSSND